jgi:hypothetical protein
MEEVNVHEGLKGVILYAKPEYDVEVRQDWLILVESIKRERYYRTSDLQIYRHASYGLKNGVFYCGEIPGNWGFANAFKFYLPTEKQKIEFIKKIAKEGYKYIPILNKLVKKT